MSVRVLFDLACEQGRLYYGRTPSITQCLFASTTSPSGHES